MTPHKMFERTIELNEARRQRMASRVRTQKVIYEGFPMASVDHVGVALTRKVARPSLPRKSQYLRGRDQSAF